MEQGNNLLVFPDAASDINTYNSFLQNAGSDIFRALVFKRKRCLILIHETRYLPMFFNRFSEFITSQVSGSFLTVIRTNTTAEPLLSFSDHSFFISKYSVGSGLLFLSTVPLDKNYTDLPLNPLFAPMIYKMAIVKETASPGAMVIGKNNMVSVPADLSTGAQVLRLKGMEQEFIPAQRLIINQVVLNINNEINQAGIYALQDQSNQVKSYIAMNYDRDESDLQFLSNDELLQFSKPFNIKVIQNTGRDLSGVISGQHLGLPLWKVSVIFVLLFMALEIVLLKFWK